MSGTVYMIPVTLGNPVAETVIAPEVRDITLTIRVFAVEEIRSARRYLKSLDRSFPIDDTRFFTIGKHSDPSGLNEFFSLVADGHDAGVMSEAGMPGLADPGNIVAAGAHARGFRVAPLTGPSSIMLALVASGLNGQSFAFSGYLPVDPQQRKQSIRELERQSAGGQTQIFMETPFRNDKLLSDLLEVCRPTTRLCIAADITLETESVVTRSVSEWRKLRPSPGKRNAVFLLLA